MPWACTVCTVINDVDEWLCCDVCGSARESPTERDAPTNVEGLHREGAEDAPPTTAEGAPSNAIVIDDDDDDAGGGAALPGPGEKRPRAPLAAGGENPSKRPKADATSAERGLT